MSPLAPLGASVHRLQKCRDLAGKCEGMVVRNQEV
jgi:hypothetical protein